jgi:hypothetical protein
MRLSTLIQRFQIRLDAVAAVRPWRSPRGEHCRRRDAEVIGGPSMDVSPEVIARCVRHEM